MIQPSQQGGGHPYFLLTSSHEDTSRVLCLSTGNETPEKVAAGLEAHVAAQQHEIPGIRIEQKSIPPSADRVRRPSVFILDDLLILTLPYKPEPAIRHRLGEPFPPLIQMVAKALFKELDAAGVKILAIQAFEENGRRYIAIAIDAAA